MFDGLIERTEEALQSKRANLNIASLLPIIGKYTLPILIAVSLIQLLYWGLFNG